MRVLGKYLQTGTPKERWTGDLAQVGLEMLHFWHATDLGASTLCVFTELREMAENDGDLRNCLHCNCVKLLFLKLALHRKTNV